MAACERCGAVPEPGATTCPECGAPIAGAHATRPLGSEGEERVGSGTLVLGSGVSITEPLPVSRRARPAPEPRRERPAPAEHQRREPRDPRRLRQRLPRALPTPEPAASERPKSKPRPRALWLLVPLGLAAAAALGLALARRRPALAAETRFDPKGRPELHVSCPSCPEGTTLGLGTETATVSSGHALLRVAPPLALGRHRTTLEVTKPGRGAAKTEELEYEVDYVVSVDQRGLGQPEPKLGLVFEAKPSVSFVVDGRVVPPAESGLRRYELGVRAELTGAARETVTWTKKVPYLVKRPTGESVRGEIELRVEVVPLVVDAPGESIVIEGSSFVLAGATERDGTITVEGRPITVDPTGRFAQLMSVSAVGDTTINVRASAPGRAPRFYPIRVKRVASLAAEAAAFERRAEASFAAISEDVDKKLGWAVVLEGKLAEVKSDGYVSSLLLEVTKGCPAAPCFARLRLGERTAQSAGATVTVYGYLAGKSTDPATGRALPEVRVEFLRGKP